MNVDLNDIMVVITIIFLGGDGLGRLNYFTKIFLLAVVTAILSSGLILVIMVYRGNHEYQQEIQSNLTSGVDQKVRLFDVYTGDLHSLSKSIADDVQIRNYFQDLKKGQEDQIFKVQLERNLEEEILSHKEVVESAFFTYQGKVYIDGLDKQNVGFDVSDQAWYGEMLKKRQHHIAEVGISPITGIPVMGSNYPILDEQGEVIAIFVLTINLNGFSKQIVENAVQSDQTTMIVDSKGMILASADEERIGSYNISNEIPELYSFIEAKGSGFTSYQADGIKYFASVKKSDYNVYIIQSMQVKTYQNSVMVSIAISLAIVMVVIAGSILVTYRIARNITKPVGILLNEFDEMSKGFYEGSISGILKGRKDEFGKLGLALEDMKNGTRSLIYNLKSSHEEVEASFEEVLAMEEELRQQNELLVVSENKLRASEKRNRAIIQALPDIVFLLNQEGIFLDCQVSDEADLLIPIHMFIGKSITEVMPKEISDEALVKIQKVFETGELQQFEYELYFKESQQIYELRIVKSDEDKVVAISRNITAQKKYQDRIEFLSFHDQLTGLYNRRFFEEEIRRLDISENLPLCIVMADVNGLKLVNDSFGHRAGDELLQKTAEILQKSCNNNESISRIGGDEFIIMIPKMKQNDLEELIQRIKTNCENETIYTINISLSLGWEAKNNLEDDILEIFNKAEDYMYRKKLHEGPSMRGKTITAIINTLYEKNRRDEQHSRRVSELCGKLAVASKMLEREVDEIKSAGLLHDIGKIAIPENLLNKPGKLTEEEFAEVARHPEIGFRILNTVNDMSDIAEFALSHHERWDGKGYPRGIAGERIPLQARMIAIADAYDAMTSERSYRSPLSQKEAADEILRNAGTQFDPKLAHLFVEEVLELEIDNEEIKQSFMANI